MTNKEAICVIKFEKACVMRQDTPECDRNCKKCDLLLPTEDVLKAYDKAIGLLQAEPLTDTEQRIFLAAMSREENACKEVCADGSDGGVDLVAVCHRIERKVKRALWRD